MKHLALIASLTLGAGLALSPVIAPAASRVRSMGGWSPRRAGRSRGRAPTLGGMPRSLVTGGAGFLGSHLCDSLLASGHEVVCLDNLFTGSLRNVEHLRGNARFRFVEHDVTEPFAFDVDHVWNLACPAACASMAIRMC